MYNAVNESTAQRNNFYSFLSFALALFPLGKWYRTWDYKKSVGFSFAFLEVLSDTEVLWVIITDFILN